MLIILLTIPSGITAAPSNLACRFVAIRGKFVQIGLEGHLGVYLGGLHVHVEAQEVRFERVLGLFSEFRKLCGWPLEVHLGAVEAH